MVFALTWHEWQTSNGKILYQVDKTWVKHEIRNQGNFFKWLLDPAPISWNGCAICLTRVIMHNVVVVHFSAGYMDASIIRDCWKADLIALLLKVCDGSCEIHVCYISQGYLFISESQKYVN
jgi:hypothetical protein